MARVQVRVFECDWPGCTAVLRTPYTTERRAKAYVWKRGWLWTADESEMHFCGTAPAPGRRAGHAQLILAEHRPSLTRLTAPCSGWYVACWCGWPGAGEQFGFPAATAGEARARWARHLVLPCRSSPRRPRDHSAVLPGGPP
ncbi:hypothetical protein [Streptomyces sp. NPDC001985]|uniref:hypothetical protein n=1 Tax=Streptomyces sp. NPDC001985 TaxID=3154406 RepID=UPI003318C0E6